MFRSTNPENEIVTDDLGSVSSRISRYQLERDEARKREASKADFKQFKENLENLKRGLSNQTPANDDIFEDDSAVLATEKNDVSPSDTPHIPHKTPLSISNTSSTLSETSSDTTSSEEMDVVQQLEETKVELIPDNTLTITKTSSGSTSSEEMEFVQQLDETKVELIPDNTLVISDTSSDTTSSEEMEFVQQPDETKVAHIPEDTVIEHGTSSGTTSSEEIEVVLQPVETQVELIPDDTLVYPVTTDSDGDNWATNALAAINNVRPTEEYLSDEGLDMTTHAPVSSETSRSEHANTLVKNNLVKSDSEDKTALASQPIYSTVPNEIETESETSEGNTFNLSENEKLEKTVVVKTVTEPDTIIKPTTVALNTQNDINQDHSFESITTNESDNAGTVDDDMLALEAAKLQQQNKDIENEGYQIDHIDLEEISNHELDAKKKKGGLCCGKRKCSIM